MGGPGGLLGGLRVGIFDLGPPFETAAWLLRGLGARVGEPPFDVRIGGGDPRAGPGADVIPATAPYREAGVPQGTVAYALGVALAAGALAGWRAGRVIGVSEIGVAIQIFLPDVMAASYDSPPAMRPRPPIRAPGTGWLHADLGSPGDPELFEQLLQTLEPDADSEKVATAAQEWRLPVCPFRPRPAAGAVQPVTVQPAQTSTRPRRAETAAPALAGVRVCDLTSMWAGPLATWLLGSLGATVYKVEPDARPDGFRALAGGGIHPGGRPVDPGRDSAMWNALNTGKERLDLDLRDPAQRSSLIALAGDCDLIIDSFSPRVMPNFGLSPFPAPGPTALSMPAFPPGPYRQWVAYGSGIHAWSGLGDCGDETYAPPLVSYPDPIGGLTGALAAVAAIVGRDRGFAAERMEVPLASATQPLLACTALMEPAGARRSPGAALLSAGLAAGAFDMRDVAGSALAHPLSLFADPGAGTSA